MIRGALSGLATLAALSISAASFAQAPPPPGGGYGPPPGGYGPPPGGYGPPPGGYGPPPGGPYGPPGGYGPPPGGYGPPPGGYGPPPGGPPPGGPPPPKQPKKTPWGIGGGGVLTLRGTRTVDSVEGSENAAYAVGLDGAGQLAGSYDFISGRGAFDLALGIGSGGIEGRAYGMAAVGGMYRLADEHGPVARLGIGALYEGNFDNYTFGFFELPALEVGYQAHEDFVMFDGGLRAAPVLAGTLDVHGDTEDELGLAPRWGAFATVFVGPLWADANFYRIERDNSITGGDARVCVAYVLALCGDARVLHRDGPTASTDPLAAGTTALIPGREVTTLVLGLSLGFGYVGQDAI